MLVAAPAWACRRASTASTRPLGTEGGSMAIGAACRACCSRSCSRLAGGVVSSGLAAPGGTASAKAFCISADHEPARPVLPQPVNGSAERGAGCVARPPPTDWVMMRRVLDERARYGV